MARPARRESFIRAMKSLAFACALLFGAPVAASAGDLPTHLVPSAPFPRILEQAPTIESIAPGVEYGDYQLYTEDGPLAVHVLDVHPHRSDLHLETVLAYNALESHGETVG